MRLQHRDSFTSATFVVVVVVGQHTQSHHMQTSISHASHAGSTYTRLAFLGQQPLVQWSARECYIPHHHATTLLAAHCTLPNRILRVSNLCQKGFPCKSLLHTPHRARYCRSPGLLPGRLAVPMPRLVVDRCTRHSRQNRPRSSLFPSALSLHRTMPAVTPHLSDLEPRDTYTTPVSLCTL